MTDDKLNFTLRNTVIYRGDSYGPHKEKPTPKGLILAIKMMEGKSRKDAQKFVTALEKSQAKGTAEEPEAGTFEAIPHYSDLVEHEPSLDSFDKVRGFGVENLTEVSGIGEVGQGKIAKYLEEHGSEEESDGESEDHSDEGSQEGSNEETEEESEDEPPEEESAEEQKKEE